MNMIKIKRRKLLQNMYGKNYITFLSWHEHGSKKKKIQQQDSPLKDCSPAYPFSPFFLILSFSFTLSLLSLFRSALLSAKSYLLTFNTKKLQSPLSAFPPHSLFRSFFFFWTAESPASHPKKNPPVC